MNKSSAIAYARSHVSIHGSGNSWSVFGPYHSSMPDGPSTERSADNYRTARRIASAWIATIALHLMGRASVDGYFAIDDARTDGIADVRTLVDIGLAHA